MGSSVHKSGVCAASQAGREAPLKSMAWGNVSTPARVLMRVWISLPDVPTKVDLHVHHVTCLAINALTISRLGTTVVSAITNNAYIAVVRSLFRTGLPQSRGRLPHNSPATEIEFPN
jgi:hypothetical protein